MSGEGMTGTQGFLSSACHSWDLGALSHACVCVSSDLAALGQP